MHSHRQPQPPHPTRRRAAVVYAERTNPKPDHCVICDNFVSSEPVDYARCCGECSGRDVEERKL